MNKQPRRFTRLDPDGWVWCHPCGKRLYFTRRDAKRMQRHQAVKGFWSMSEVDVYRCAELDGWHIGHPTPADLARKERGA